MGAKRARRFNIGAMAADLPGGGTDGTGGTVRKGRHGREWKERGGGCMDTGAEERTGVAGVRAAGAGAEKRHGATHARK